MGLSSHSSASHSILSPSQLLSWFQIYFVGSVEHTSLISIYITPPLLLSLLSWFSFLSQYKENSASMRSPTSLKREFLKKWMTGLQLCTSPKKEMSFTERKKAIKLSADVAMASARNAATQWSRALISKASSDDTNRGLVVCILGSPLKGSAPAATTMMRCSELVSSKKISRSRRILRKSRGVRRAKKKASSQKAMASCIAKRLVKKRTQVLKSLVPGGESMSDVSLIEETLDYILSLRAQVDVMRHISNVTELLNRK